MPRRRFHSLTLVATNGSESGREGTNGSELGCVATSVSEWIIRSVKPLGHHRPEASLQASDRMDVRPNGECTGRNTTRALA